MAALVKVGPISRRPYCSHTRECVAVQNQLSRTATEQTTLYAKAGPADRADPAPRPLSPCSPECQPLDCSPLPPFDPTPHQRAAATASSGNSASLVHRPKRLPPSDIIGPAMVMRDSDNANHRGLMMLPCELHAQRSFKSRGAFAPLPPSSV